MKFIKSPAFYYAIVILLILIRLIFDIPSLGRSFWTDEVWVANSIVSPSLSQLFYPDTWLQTTAPLFLLLVRATSLVAGISETALRLVPYLMAILAALGFAILVRRVLQPAAAILATALFFFTPQLFIYARLLKQYSAELALTVAVLLAAQFYLASRSNPRFLVLLVASIVGLGFGYGLAFLLPSLLILTILPLFSAESSIEVKRKALLQASCFVLCAVATLIAEYYYFVLPNSSEVLTQYWQHPSSQSLSQLLARQSFQLFQRSMPFLPMSPSLHNPKHLLVVLAILSTLACGLASSFRRSANTPLRSTAYATLFALLVADLLGIYPAIDRTIFFTLPLSVFLLADGLQSFWELTIDRLQWRHGQLLILALSLTTSLALGLSFKNPPAGEGEFNFEDYQSAMKYLKAN
ncbi:MAG: glycosyltransferase family 39 protein, partial [Acidobacteria bacterium]|nr:glycosyltransferase family 39 protein [Acidobacteriota bacterium]